jgi:hypothetical protein
MHTHYTHSFQLLSGALGVDRGLQYVLCSPNGVSERPQSADQGQHRLSGAHVLHSRCVGVGRVCSVCVCGESYTVDECVQCAVCCELWISVYGGCGRCVLHVRWMI